MPDRENLLPKICCLLVLLYVLSIFFNSLQPDGLSTLTPIYIYKALRSSVSESVTFCLSPGDKQFVCPPGDKHFSHTGEGGGQTILTYGGGDKHFWHTGGDKHFCHTGGDKQFYTEREGQTFLHWEGGGQTFYVEDVGGDDDVDGEEEDVSEANILVREASKP